MAILDPDEYNGRVAITWPRNTGLAVSAWGIRIHDADSGQELGHITTAATINIDPRGVVTADLTMLVDADGNPVEEGAKPALDAEAGEVRTGVFRYAVASSGTKDDPHAACTALTDDELRNFLLREARRMPPRRF